MVREIDLIDVWFDSGAMPYAQLHYPFENKDLIDKNEFYPADFISEGVDQTRGWFFTLHAISTMVMDSVAFKNVVSTGLVLDKKGVKMSKRLGNAIEPFEAIEKYGTDAIRWYMISNAQPWDNLKFDLDGVDEVKRKFFGTLYNTYGFFALYANIDEFKFEEEYIALADRPEIDKWIISLLNTLKQDVKTSYADYEPTQAARRIMEFVDKHLSNWYVRLCRRRFWKGEYAADKIAAYQTLYECLSTIAQLMSPVSPFFSDWLFKNLNDITGRDNNESVHLALFPAIEESAIDKDLEERMDYAQRISSLVLSLRKGSAHRVRQPLQKILLPILDEDYQQQVEKVKDLILAEVNVKDIEYITDTDGIIKKRIKPNFKTLGRKMGKHMKAAAAAINQLTDNDISAIEQSRGYQLEVEGTSYDLSLEDFEISFDDIPGWQVAIDQNLTVALDVSLTDELLAEGTARELVNRIQNIRKNKEFNVTDKINILVEANDAVKAAVQNHKDYICNETLAVGLDLSYELSGESTELFDDVSVIIDVQLN